MERAFTLIFVTKWPAQCHELKIKSYTTVVYYTSYYTCNFQSVNEVNGDVNLERKSRNYRITIEEPFFSKFLMIEGQNDFEQH